MTPITWTNPMPGWYVAHLDDRAVADVREIRRCYWYGTTGNLVTSDGLDLAWAKRAAERRVRAHRGELPRLVEGDG